MASVDLPEPKKHTEMTSKLTDQLTDRQARILEYIRYQNKVRNYPPSVREIGEAVGLSSSSTVHNHLNQLERRGLIRRDPSKSRTVQLVQDEELDKQRRNAISVPVVGNDATVKRFERGNGHVKLIAENPAYEPIVSSNVSLVGVVRGVIRLFR